MQNISFPKVVLRGKKYHIVGNMYIPKLFYYLSIRIDDTFEYSYFRNLSLPKMLDLQI